MSNPDRRRQEVRQDSPWTRLTDRIAGLVSRLKSPTLHWVAIFSAVAGFTGAMLAAVSE